MSEFECVYLCVSYIISRVLSRVYSDLSPMCAWIGCTTLKRTENGNRNLSNTILVLGNTKIQLQSTFIFKLVFITYGYSLLNHTLKTAAFAILD